MTMLEMPATLDWTPQALERLPDEFRYEVREGNLVIMAAAMRPWHADVQARVRNVLVRQGRRAYIEQGVVLPEEEIRTCDVGVFAQPPLGNAVYHPASAFELLIEVVSQGSRREDRENKPKLYAAAGIPEYWRVEEGADGEALVYRFRLARTVDGGGVYTETGVVTLTTLESALPT